MTSAGALARLLLVCWAAGLAGLASGEMPAAAAPGAASADKATPSATSPPASCFMSECLDVLGGGNITSSPVGDFPEVSFPGCKSQLASYLSSGAYLRAVGVAARSAVAPEGQPTIRGGLARVKADTTTADRAARAKQLTVFDIDETLLSNIQAAPEMFVGGPSSATAGRRRLLSAMALENLPPLAPVKEVYQAVCAAGHPIALITGRKEKNRAITIENLKRAGYGELCPGNATRAEEGAPCCYSALVLRAPGDNSLASVYKPRARGELMKKHGFEIYAAYGDQFSDFNGENAPLFAFKIPNPFYTVL